MRAIALYEHGGIDKLVACELPTPEPGPGEVLVRVEAVALNHLDLWVRKGIPGLKLTYPHLLGADIAGELVSDGSKVIVSPVLSCMRCRDCLSGRDNLCRHFGLLGEHRSGGYAQYIAVPACNIVPRPTGMSAVDAAALPVTGLTAWQMLVKKAKVLPGETVLVIAAGSGVGVAAVQIAKLLGARVIATATSDAKLERARALGADETINTSTHDLVEGVKSLTGKRGADVIIEHVGKALWSQCILACATGGRIVTCGATTGFDAVTDLRHVFFRQLSILGSTMGSKGDLFDIVEQVKAGKIRPVIDRVLPLAEARKAHELLEGRQQFGKIVLEVPHP
ncbi:MAG: zinc-binding dehydrogenase [Deltaproteobacteria bacterium]|nr:zinc-binding dehydrogenase [Deltaproteobacteria bacterium]